MCFDFYLLSIYLLYMHLTSYNPAFRIDKKKVHVLGTPEELDIFRETVGENG